MADTPDYQNGQPAPLPNEGASMHDLVIGDLRARQFYTMRHIPLSPVVQQAMIYNIRKRKIYGFEKYGTVLQANNGRDASVDAEEEVIDLLVYLKQMMMERPGDGFIQLAYSHAIEAYAAVLKSRMIHTDVVYPIEPVTT